MHLFYSAPGILISIAGMAIAVMMVSYIFDALLPQITDRRKTAAFRIGAAATAVMIVSAYLFAISLFFWN